MDKRIQTLCYSLEAKIQAAYEESITIEEAEKLAAEFLHAQLRVAEALRVASLDARMRKQGVKAIRAAMYLEEVRKTEKKPSDVMLDALVTSNEIVGGEQTAFDTAEVEAEALQNYLRIFEAAHVFFRQISKASG